MTHKVTKFLTIPLMVVVLSIVVYLSIEKPVATNTQELHLTYAADFSDDRILMGASHNVFIGKVIAQTGAKKLNSAPETQFSVEIIKNIKGELTGEVTVNQFGGYENDVLFVVENEVPFLENADMDPDYLLKAGQTYLFATRYNEEEDWYTLNSFPTARKLITTERSLPAAAIRALADNDSRVRQIEAAYPNEVLFQPDLASNNNRNRYKGVQESR